MGRILGVDYGDSRIGLALSDPNKIIASPFKTIKNKGFDKTKKEIFDIIRANKTLKKLKKSEQRKEDNTNGEQV